MLGFPRVAFTMATRAALGAGVGLLVLSRMPQSRRRNIGASLVAIGTATTIPAIMQIVRGRRRSSRARRASIGQDGRLIGATRFPRKGDDIF